eukprot:scaffold44496_cov64-Phaeocystis_antarctica.AAC.2
MTARGDGAGLRPRAGGGLTRSKIRNLERRSGTLSSHERDVATLGFKLQPVARGVSGIPTHVGMRCALRHRPTSQDHRIAQREVGAQEDIEQQIFLRYRIDLPPAHRRAVLRASHVRQV